jgi:hypothetical protein
VAARYQRGEQRRQEREMRAFEQHQLHQPEAPSAVWNELEPHLAGALDALSGADREAVLLRFYRQASHRQHRRCGDRHGCGLRERRRVKSRSLARHVHRPSQNRLWRSSKCWAVVFGVRWLASALLSSRITAMRQQFESDEKPLPYAATGALQTSSRTFAAQRIDLHSTET